MAKRVSRIGFGLGQSGHESKRVIFKQVKRVASWVGSSWPVFFKQIFFFEVDAICQLFMSSLTVIKFSLVILLPIITKHLTWCPNLVQLLFNFLEANFDIIFDLVKVGRENEDNKHRMTNYNEVYNILNKKE